MTTHSPEAEAFARAELGMAPDEPNEATGISTSEDFNRVAYIFDSGLSSKHLTDRETIWRTIAEHHQIGAKCRCGFDPRLDYNRMSQHIADAILSSPSLSLVAAKDAVAEALWGILEDDATEGWTWAEDVGPNWKARYLKIADALFASGVVQPRIEVEACPAIGPSGQHCIGRAFWHEVHADAIGSTWRDYAGKAPGLTHEQVRSAQSREKGHNA